MKHYEAADVPQKAVVVKKLCRGDAVGGEHMEGVSVDSGRIWIEIVL